MASKSPPVLITVYDRLEHLKKSIEALIKCPGSENTKLYIASDAASQYDDFEKISLVREYVKKIDGFKEVILLARNENLGAVENYRLAKEEVFKESDSLIFLEDDVIVGLGFLKFMNLALDKYEAVPDVIGVCAYLPPGMNFECVAPIFLKSRAPYGFGVWRRKEKVLSQKQNVDYIKECFSSFNFFREYEKNNPQVARSITNIVRTGGFYADIVTSVVMQREGWLAIYPPTSISKTIGNDGTGIHAGSNLNLLQQEVSHDDYDIDIVEKPSVSQKHQALRAKYYRMPFSKIINYASYFIYRISSRRLPLDYVGLVIYKHLKNIINKQ